MVKIGICDDEKNWIDKLQITITNWLNANKHKAEIYTFSNGEDLINMVSKTDDNLDIVFLDIDIPEINGFEIAATLRRLSPDMLIMFFSSHEKFVYKSFEYQPFRYIRKEYTHPEVGIALKAAFNRLEQNHSTSVVLKTQDCTMTVQSSELTYIELDNRRCIVHLKDGRTVSIRKTLRELLIDLNDPRFIYIHSGCAANIKYIRSFNSYEIIMDDGTELIASRKNIKNIRKVLLQYWGDNL